MIELDVKSDVAEGLKAIYWAYPDQITYAAAWALNETAKECIPVIKQQMVKDIKNPTSFTLNSLRIDYAKKDNLVAQVLFKDFAIKGRSAGKYLKPIIDGGERRLKGIEVGLKANGLLPEGSYVVPAQGSPLNAYGNLSPTLYARIMSYLRSHRTTTGAAQNRAGNDSKNRRKSNDEFIAITEQRGKLAPGIYQRKSKSFRMILAFVKKPTYKKQFKFFETAEKTAKANLPLKLKLASEKATAYAQRSADRFVGKAFSSLV